ncbi:type II toxin-antitoxin system PemK/MazF family toxin [Candidatus Woesearchaeota archaeon]|jgi:mRNA interferase MazF|nr:type II toxin-antitoxin system PemK/MazF family toxin [Candidatus Woesearchaeota archaeon]
MKINRGDILFVDFEPVKGSEQGGFRPSLVLQNNKGNLFSPLTIVAPITSKEFLKEYPTNVFIPKGISNLKKDSTILLNQIRTIDKTRVRKKVCNLNDFYMKKVEIALKISLGIN